MDDAKIPLPMIAWSLPSSFEQEQISRAVELGLGVSRARDIKILTDDEAGNGYAERLRKVLEQG